MSANFSMRKASMGLRAMGLAGISERSGGNRDQWSVSFIPASSSRSSGPSLPPRSTFPTVKSSLREELPSRRACGTPHPTRDQFNQVAVGRVSRYNGLNSGPPSSEQGGLAVHAEIGFLLLGTMAFQTVFPQNRLDMTPEVDGIFRRHADAAEYQHKNGRYFHPVRHFENEIFHTSSKWSALVFARD